MVVTRPCSSAPSGVAKRARDEDDSGQVQLTKRQKQRQKQKKLKDDQAKQIANDPPRGGKGAGARGGKQQLAILDGERPAGKGAGFLATSSTIKR